MIKVKCKYCDYKLEKPRWEHIIHNPTQKPVDLLEIFVKTSSKENDVVLDMFAGSGSTAIACINTNRFFIGIEKEKKCVDIANKRIEEHKKTGRNADISTFDFNHEECQKPKDGDDMKLKELKGKYAFISHPFTNDGEDLVECEAEFLKVYPKYNPGTGIRGFVKENFKTYAGSK